MEMKKPMHQMGTDGSNKTPGSPKDIKTELATIQKPAVQIELEESAVHGTPKPATIGDEQAKNIDQASTTDPKDVAANVAPSTIEVKAPTRPAIAQSSEPGSKVREAQRPKETVSVGKPQENVSVKKTPKTEVGQTLQPGVMITVGSHSTIDGAKPSLQNVIKDPVAGEVQVPTIASGEHSAELASGNTEREALVAPSQGISAGPAAVTKLIAQPDGSSRSYVSRDKDSSTLDGQVAPAAPEDKTSSKSDQRLLAHENNSDVSSAPVGASAPPAMHSIVSGASVLHGAAPAVPMGSEMGMMKPQTGDADISKNHIFGHEQEGSSLVGGSAEAMPRTLTATPTTLEVGIQNGTHGWLKVRAEMSDGGVVNAAVSASSSTGQEMLHRELPSLTNYLSAEKVAVNVVVTHSAATSGDRPGGAGGMDSGGGQTSQRSDQEGERRQSFSRTTTDSSEEDTNYQGLQVAERDKGLPLAIHVGGGSWLSVRA